MPIGIIGAIIAQVVQQMVQQLIQKIQEMMQNNASQEDMNEGLKQDMDAQGVTDPTQQADALAEVAQVAKNMGLDGVSEVALNALEALKSQQTA